MNGDTHILQVSKLTKAYRHQVIFRNLNLVINKGEWVGVIGDNGSGKSTLAKTIMGLEDGAEGYIYLGNRSKDHFSRNEWVQEVQLVTQYTRNALDPTKKIRELLLEPLRLFQLANKKEGLAKIGQMLESCSLSLDLLDQRPREISGGQYQRICIALALLVQPKLMICDEATASLDMINELRIIELLKRNTEMAVLFISHNQELVTRVCDRCIYMRKFL